MLIFSYKLEKYIKKKLLPKILLVPNKYVIKGSFRRRIQYVTDVDVINNIYPEITSENIYEAILKLLDRLNKKENTNIILVCIKCGIDNRFNIITGSNEELGRIRNLLLGDDVNEFDFIMKKYSDNFGKKIFFINELIWKYFKLSWTPEEIRNNQKILPKNIVVKFSDIVKENGTLLLQYFVKIQMYPLGIDAVINYSPTKNTHQVYVDAGDYQVKLANYRKEYYFMLFPIRAHFRNVDKKIGDEMEDLIENKFGLYKQLLVLIDAYHSLYHSNNLDIRLATAIVINIIRDVKYLPNFVSNTINEIQQIAQNNPPDVKMEKWSTLLSVLYDDINASLNTSTEDYFYKYLELLPPDLQNKYYYDWQTD